MIREAIIIDKESWDRLTVELARAIWNQYEVGYGFKLVRNEDGGTVDSLAEITGSLTLPVEATIRALTRTDA